MNKKTEFSEWKVYFEGGFWEHEGRDHAGKEIPVGKEFQWGNNHWLVPAIYFCSRGLVVDFCVQIPSERIQAFIDKWNLSTENDDDSCFSHEQQIQMNAENPLCVDAHYEAIVNGKELRDSHGYGISWNSCVSEGFAQEIEAQAVVEHYGLNPADGWVVWRQCFRWATKRRPEIKSLSVKLKQNRIAMPGPQFKVEAPGDGFEFVYPATGQIHTLTVQEYERQEVPKNSFEHLPDMEFPTHYTAMSYTITPDLPDGVITIQDCAECDPPRMKKRNPIEPEARSSFACIGIIGGAHGPTAIICGSTIQSQLRAACSSPHFEPVEDVEWCMIFNEKTLEDMAVELI